MHILSPNIYRSTSEALESFDYITTHGMVTDLQSCLLALFVFISFWIIGIGQYVITG